MINEELEKIAVWLATISLNLDKTKFISKQKRISAINGVVINNKSIEQVKENVFLGIVLDENLTWKSYVCQVSIKV